jgi:hypothetical protein
MTAKPVKKAAPAELCKGGDKAREGCVDCGDRLFMDTTGQQGKPAPVSYEGWREMHIKYGTDWAKERMLDFIRPEHMGVLDPAWTGEEKKPAKPAIRPQKVPRLIGVQTMVWSGGLAWAGSSFVMTGKVLDLYCAILYVILIVLNVITARKKRAQAQSRNRMIS